MSSSVGTIIPNTWKKQHVPVTTNQLLILTTSQSRHRQWFVLEKIGTEVVGAVGCGFHGLKLDQLILLKRADEIAWI